jgi:hypothetical protein
VIFLSEIDTLSVADELKYIDEINTNLSIYQNTLITNFEEESIIINGFFICELMINLIIKKEGNTQDITFYKLCKRNELIPTECSDFLSIIRDYRNTMVHTQELIESIIPFLKAFNYFIIWFDEYYKNKYSPIMKFNIKECYNTINSIIAQKEEICPECGLEIQEGDKFCIHCGTSLKEYEIPKMESDEIHESKTLKKVNLDCDFNIPNQKTEYIEKDIILEKLNEQNELLLELLKKVNNIDNKIDYIINEITTLQSYTERLIRYANSETEIENIINAYADQCIENIFKNYIIINDDQTYNVEKRKLIYSLGENAWNKLSDKSQTFLITSKVMFNKLILMDEVIDYSGICVLITKALEVEMNKRFFTDFIQYLDKTYDKNYSKYPTPLLFKKQKPLFDEKISLGSFQLILCLKEDRYASPDEKRNNKEKLLEYCKNCLFSNVDENKIEDLLNYYATSIEEIRVKYRNPSAHTNEIKRVDAEECFNLVLDVEKLLKKMLDSFDY